MSEVNKELITKIYKQGDLDFIWNAYKKSGVVYSQFELDEKGELKENMFTDIDSNPDNYKKFELVNVINPDETFSVDLETGDFNFKGVIIKNNININNQVLKCIFWRRKAITLNIASSRQSSKYLHYLIGWHTNLEGASVKKEYRVFVDGTVQEVLHKQNRKVYSKASIVKK